MFSDVARRRADRRRCPAKAAGTISERRSRTPAIATSPDGSPLNGHRRGGERPSADRSISPRRSAGRRRAVAKLLEGRASGLPACSVTRISVGSVVAGEVALQREEALLRLEALRERAHAGRADVHAEDRQRRARAARAARGRGSAPAGAERVDDGAPETSLRASASVTGRRPISGRRSESTRSRSSPSNAGNSVSAAATEMIADEDRAGGEAAEDGRRARSAARTSRPRRRCH